MILAPPPAPHPRRLAAMMTRQMFENARAQLAAERAVTRALNNALNRNHTP